MKFFTLNAVIITRSKQLLSCFNAPSVLRRARRGRTIHAREETMPAMLNGSTISGQEAARDVGTQFAVGLRELEKGLCGATYYRGPGTHSD